MIAIRAEKLGRRWGGRWLFRNLSIDLAAGQTLRIVGASGSGKSTLLRMLAGQLLPTEGSVAHRDATGTLIDPDDLYHRLSWAAPALEPHPALTLRETYSLHFGLRASLVGGTDAALEALGLAPQAETAVGKLSSGQQQRARLGLALFSASELLILDEPTTHLDEATADRMLGLISQFRGGRTLVVASNLAREAVLAERELSL